jgi:hypothetical protein
MIGVAEITEAAGGMGSTFMRAFAVMVTLGMAVVFAAVVSSARGHARMWAPGRPAAGTAYDPEMVEAPTDAEPVAGTRAAPHRSSLRAAIQKTGRPDDSPPEPDPARGAEAVDVGSEPEPSGEWLAQIRVSRDEWKTIGAGGTRAEAARQAARIYAAAPSGQAPALELRIIRG